jgi:hypothetical protein
MGAPGGHRNTEKGVGARDSCRDRRSVDGRGSPWSDGRAACGALPLPWGRGYQASAGEPAETFEVRAGSWSSGPVRVITAPAARRIGAIPVLGPLGVVLRARSIHTFGMLHRIGVIAVDGDGVVTATGVLPPRRLWTVPSAVSIIEVPPAAGLPVVGAAATPYRRVVQHDHVAPSRCPPTAGNDA